jgi:hypothetical protein
VLSALHKSNGDNERISERLGGTDEGESDAENAFYAFRENPRSVPEMRDNDLKLRKFPSKKSTLKHCTNSECGGDSRNKQIVIEIKY